MPIRYKIQRDQRSHANRAARNKLPQWAVAILYSLTLYIGTSTGLVLADADGDGTPDSSDLDNDNNGVLDTNEYTDSYKLPEMDSPASNGVMTYDYWFDAGASESATVDTNFPDTDALGLPWYSGSGGTSTTFTAADFLTGDSSTTQKERAVFDTYLTIPHGNYLEFLKGCSAVSEIQIKVQNAGVGRVAHYWASDGVPANATKQGENFFGSAADPRIVSTVSISIDSSHDETVQTFWQRIYVVDDTQAGKAKLFYSLDSGTTWTVIPAAWFSTSSTGWSASDLDYVLQSSGNYSESGGDVKTEAELLTDGACFEPIDYDTDGDGITDAFDIDNDNDGITDSVEIQATQSYIAPSGVGAAMTDADNDGLDDNYDANDSDASAGASIGLSAVDTDSDGTDDFYDDDSDADGIDDIAERDDGGPTSISSTTDTDSDGLLDIFEGSNNNDAYDVNDENLDGSGNFNLGGDALLDADGGNASPDTLDLYFRDDTPAAPTVTSQTTGDTTPTISGSATLGPGESLSVIVNSVTYTVGDGNLTHNSSTHSWSLTIPAANTLAENTYAVTATVSHTIGTSTSDATNDELVIDTTPPAVTPTVTSQTTGDTTPTLTGTATLAAGESLTVTVDSVVYSVGDGNLTHNSGDNTWALTIPAGNALTDGTYSVTATVTDGAGNSLDDGTSNELVVDNTPPAVTPAVSSQTTNDTTPTITGTATLAAGESLTVTVDGVTYTVGDGNLTHNSGDNTWSLTIPGGDALTEGTYSVTATVTDSVGNSVSDATSNELIIDTTAPAVTPTVSSQTTNDTTPTITGTATLAAGESLTVTVDGVTYTVGDGNLTHNSGDNTWSLTIPAGDALTEGTYDVTATVTDAAGNTTSDSTNSELDIDTTGPAVTPTVAAQSTNDTTPTVTGTATLASGESLTVTVDGTTYTVGDGNLTHNSGDNTWSLTIPGGDALTEGTYSITATVEDGVGNAVSDATSNELVIDTTAPAVAPTVSAQTTNDSTPTITGSATLASGETLTVTVDGNTYTAGDGNLTHNSGDNTWSLTIPVADTLSDATYEITATVSDTAGNTVSDPTSNELIVDTTAPTVTPTVTSLSTPDTTPTLAGTATLGAGEALSVVVNSITYTVGDGNLTHNSGDNTWSLTIPGGNALSEGTYDVAATVTDTAGNTTSDITSNELTVDTTAPTAPSVNAQTSNDTTPTITGSATLGTGEALSVVVDGVTYTVGDGNLTHNSGDNTWSLTIPGGNALTEGTYDVAATVTDGAGNSASDATSNELVIDTTAPAVTPAVTAQSTNDTTPTLTGTATLGTGESLTVTVDGNTYTAGDGNLTHNSGDNTWSLTIPAGNALTDNTYQVVATVTDTAGNSTSDVTSNELTVDTTAPAVTPTVTALTTNDTTPTIVGTATLGAGESLTVSVDGETYSVGDGNLTHNSGDNTWSLTLPAADALSEGTYSVTATVTDGVGNSVSDATSNELEIDTTAPAVTPVVSAQTTNDTTPTVTGTATLASGESLTVTVDGETYTVGDGNLTHNSGDNTWSLTIPAGDALAEGTYSVTAIVTDSAGNSVSDVTANELDIDTTAPAVTPTVTSQTTSDTTPTIIGTATLGTGESLSVTVDGNTYTVGDGNLTHNGGANTWSLTIPIGDALAEGTFDVTATVSDTAGNTTSDASSNELVVDTTAPTTAPTVASQTTNDTTPTITGTATLGTGESLTVTVDGTSYTVGDGNLTHNSGDNTWSLTIPAGDALGEGTHDVTATVTDAASNTTTDATSNELVIDTTAPAVTPTVSTQTTNDTTPTVTGTATLGTGESLSVTVDGTTYTVGDGNLTHNSGANTWSLTIPAGDTLAEGTYDVAATVTDTAGNATSDATSSELVVDTTSPATTPTVTTANTNDTTPTVTGTATLGTGESLTVTVDGVTYTAGDGNLTHNSGDNTWSLTIPAGNALAEGTHDVTATVTDTAGNTTTDVTNSELVIDTTNPTVPTVATQTTNDTTPTITGTATLGTGESLSVTVDGETYTVGDGNLTHNSGANTWSLTIPAGNALAEGSFEVAATVTDTAGNSSTDVSSNEVIIDTTAPAVSPTVTALNTSDTTPTVTGTATLATGESLSVVVDGVTYTAGDGNLTHNSGDNTWSLTIPAGNALAEGDFDVAATVTDSAGNTTTDATTNELTIDTSAPAAPTVTALTTNDTTPTINGTATLGSGESLSVTVDGTTYTVGDGNLTHTSGANTWSLTIPAADTLTEGTYDVTATVTDSASNATSDASSNELVIDTTAPGTPAVTALTTNDTTPTVTGSATLGTGETLSVTIDGETYTVGDGNLTHNSGDNTWSLTLPAADALSEGTFEVAATITDAAGNTSTDITSNELVIDTTDPTTPTVTALSTNSTTPTITGTATLGSGETLSVIVDGTTYTVGDGNLTYSSGDNTWSLTIPAGNALTDGTFDVTATVADSAGNAVSDGTSSELVVDTSAPTVPTVSSLTTNDTTPSLSGTATVGTGESLTVTVNGTTYSVGDGNLTHNSGDNTWALTLPAGDALSEGTYDVTATITDGASNTTSDATSNELVIDTTAPSAPTANTLTTNDTTPTLSGSATLSAGDVLSVTVDGNTYTTGDGNLTHNSGDNTWSLTLPAADELTEGNFDVTATVTDAAGNATNDATSSELTLDTTAPTAPAVIALTDNDTTPTITGTATLGTGDVLTVTVDGVTYTVGDGNLTHNSGDNTWSLTIPAGDELAEGTFEVTATTTDSAGNSTDDSTSNELIIDTTAPAAPGVTSQTTADTTPTISGTMPVGSGMTLTVDVDGVTYTEGDGDLTNNTDGTWTLVVPAGNTLAEGSYDVTATMTDTAGNTSSDPSSAELVVDTTAPSTPGVTSLTTNNTTPAISGTATLASGETLSVTVNGVTYTEGDGNLTHNSGDNTWSLTIPAANTLPEGTFNVAATVTDTAGNTSTDPSTDELVVDTTAPVAPGVDALTTNSTSPTLTGTATLATGESLSVTVDGETYTLGDGNLTHNSGDNTWSLLIPVANALTEGTYEVLATATDAAGNATNDASSNELVVDTTAPAVTPTVVAQTSGTTTPTITGTATLGTGESLSVTVNGVVYTVGDGNLSIDGGGNWTLVVPAGNALTEGTYNVLATVTDEAGNTTTDATTDELVIDTTAPAAPVVTAQTTNDTTPSISGTALLGTGESLSVAVNGVTYTDGDGNLSHNSLDNSWTLNIPAGNALPESTYEVTATTSDAAGNTTSDSTSNELVLDITAPAVPTVTAQTSSDTTPTLSGTAVLGTGENLTVTVNGTTYTVGDGNLTHNSGDNSWSLTLPGADALTDGTYSVTATTTDAAGNSSSDATSSELVIDTTAPTTPTVSAATTNDTTPTITGAATLAAGETLSVTVDGTTYTAGDGNLTHNSGDNSWSLTIPAANTLTEGTYPVTATVTDSAGNTASDATTNELVIDTTSPAVPTVASATSNDTTPTISGTATLTAGETLTVTVDGVTYTDGDGNLSYNGTDNTWSLTVPAANVLSEGTFDVTATVTDAAGNSTSDGTNNELVIDTTAPAAPTATAQTTNDTTPTLTGTALLGAGETLTVSVNGVTYTAGDGNLTHNGGDNSWSLTIPAANTLAEGNLDVTATVTDTAGNATSDATSSELTIDTTAPAAPVVTAQSSNDTTPVISGTATLGAGEILSVTIDGVTYTDGDGNLSYNGTDNTWSLAVPAANALAEGNFNVTATVTDTAGNSTNDITVGELSIDTTAPAAPTVTPSTSNDTTPTVVGTAVVGGGETLTVTINGVTYTAGDGNLSHNGADNTWSLTIPAANSLSEDTFEVTATVVDAAGNSTSDGSNNELVVDTSYPATPVVTASETSDTTPAITGAATLAAGETLTVNVDGVTYTAGDGNLTHNSGDDSWSLTIPAGNALAEGTFNVSATVTDAAGNISTDATSGELVIDTTSPAAPTVTTATTNDPTPTISGTAVLGTGETLSVTVNGVTYTVGDGNLTYNSADNTWALNVPTGDSLTDGTYEVTATVTDAAGNSSDDASSNELTIDSSAPASPPTVNTATTNDTTPSLSGTASLGAGDTLTVTVDGVTYSDGDGNLSYNGGSNAWTLTIPAANELIDGTFEVIATITDSASNSTDDTSNNELVIDTAAPAIAPVVTAIDTNSTTPTITGTATLAVGETLTVTVDGVTYTDGDGNLTYNGTDNTWSLVIPAGNALTEGTFDVTATVTDAAGNTTTDATSDELDVDTTEPTVPTVSTLSTNSATPTITGTATLGTGETLSVVVDGVTYTVGDGNLTHNSTDNTWSLTIPAGNDLSEGTHDIAVTVTDAAGNASTDSSTDELDIDITAPGAPTVDSQTINSTEPVLTGTATPGTGETLTVTVDGVTYTDGDGNLTYNGTDNTWSLAIPAANALGEGLFDVTATITDDVGNQTSDNTADELIIDTTAPPAPGVTSVTTAETTPTLSGTMPLGTGLTLTVEVGGITYTEGDGDLVNNLDGTWTLTVPAVNALTEGTHDVTATMTDSAGNSATDPGSAELVIDTTAPVTPGVTSVTTNSTTPTVTGTADVDPGETLTVTVNGVTYTDGDGNLTYNDADNTWSLTVPPATVLPEGTHEVTVTVTDTAGNTSSDPSSNELLIDTTAPVSPTVDTIATSGELPTITGTATLGTGEALVVTVDGTTYAVGDGNLTHDPVTNTWSLTLPAGSELTDGTYEVTATVTDAAGNGVTDVQTDELTVDTTAPVNVPVITAVETNTVTPVITGTAVLEPGETLTVTVDGVTYTDGDGFLTHNPIDNTWTLAVPGANSLPEGTFEVTATITDASGNSTNDATTSELTIDTTPPTEVPAVTSVTVNTGTPVVTGTATLEPGDTLTVTVDGVTYTDGDGSLTHNPSTNTWSLSIPSSQELDDGDHDVVVSVTDPAGNITTDATTDEVSIMTTPPVAPVVDAVLVNSQTPTLTGTATLEPGDLLEITVGGQTYTPGDGNLVVHPGGIWELQIPVGGALPEGTTDVVATITDPAGNVSSDAQTGEVQIDLTPPPAPGVTGLVTASATPILHGSSAVASDLTLQVEVNGVIYEDGDGHLTDHGNGFWSLEIPTSNALSDGTYEVIATLIDGAGNSATDPGTNELVVDTSGPATTDLVAPGITSTVSISPTPTISGTVTLTDDDEFTVTVNGVTYVPGDGNLSIDEFGIWTLTIPDENPLTAGTYDVVATIIDSEGNSVTDATTEDLVVDFTAVTAPTIDEVVITPDETPVIEGTVTLEPDDDFTVTVDGTTYTPGDGFLVIDGGGNWSLELPTTEELAPGTYEITATVTDESGDTVSDSSIDELVVTQPAPEEPNVNSVISTEQQPVISGSVDLQPGEELTVEIDGEIYTSGPGEPIEIDDNGNWTLTLPEDHLLSTGDTTVTAIVTNTDGISTDSTATVTVSVPAPTLTINTDPTDNPLRPELSGETSEPDGTTITVTDSQGNELCDAEVASGSWSCIPDSDLTEGESDLSATVNGTSGTTTVSLTVTTDEDADGDGISDVNEGTEDSDGDGIADRYDLDSDNDGILDRDEGRRDSDSDGIPDYLDLDTDNDGIPDSVEAGGVDTNSDYLHDGYVDANGNGLHDDLEPNPLMVFDTDHDGIPDYRDLDSDQDGITDIRETNGLDLDEDGRVDDFLDANGDGIDDGFSLAPVVVSDTDGDGLYDYRDLDSDNDDLSDLAEAGGLDLNDDGLLDSVPDVDRDSIPDHVDVDQTNGVDINNNGIDDRFDALILFDEDYDGDGIADQFDPDADGDGYADDGFNYLIAGAALPDSDADGTPDFQQAHEGMVHTGLAGSGCSMAFKHKPKNQDPLLALLACFSALWLFRRRAVREAAEHPSM